MDVSHWIDILRAYWKETLLGVGIPALFVGFFLRLFWAKLSKRSAEKMATQVIEKAQVDAQTKRKEMELHAKEEIHRARDEFEKELKERRQEITQLEKRILQREETLEKRTELFEKKELDFRNREKNIKTKEEQIQIKEKELENVLEVERVQLQNLAGVTREDAKRLLLTKIEEEVQSESALVVRQSENRIHQEIDRKARELVVDAMQRCVMDHVQDVAVTTVSLASDEIKGKIIGREGRNIRTFEMATGVDLIIDDTPGTIVISAFDMVRREIARIALEQLIRDGRIHPSRIEEVVAKVKQEIDETIRRAGEEAVIELGLVAIHPEIVKLVGRLKYRTSYGQNVLEHSKEVAWLMGALAADLKMDVKLAKRIGLLHDIGKALSHEVEGSHAVIGGDFARKFRESEECISGIAGHHAEIAEMTVWGTLCQVADAISAARPGARSDTVENYLQRLEKLEAVANAFKGVERSYAIQAGREIRVIVKPDEVNEDAAFLLSRDIAKKIQGELQYPGVIKVTVIRETRSVEFAR